MNVSVFSPVKNEAEYIGYSIMDCIDHVKEFVYACAKSDDGTDELLDYIKKKYAGDKLKILRSPEFDFNPHDMPAYNNAYNACIKEASGDAVFFKHPDMICTNPWVLNPLPDALAWWTNLTSIAEDKVITKGRATRWKNIHSKKFGLHYYGAYGSQEEDMYHSDITGAAHVHHGEEFKKYPFKVADSGLQVYHFCESKNYKRRFEKMKMCLKTLYPNIKDVDIAEAASKHPRVTLDESNEDFGQFEFKRLPVVLPDVFGKYKEEFDKVLGRG